MVEEGSFNKSEIWLERFSKGRLKEMIDLKEKVKKRRGQLPSQRVPHHMRRRAVSHNPNRLPARLRSQHTQERISGGGGGIDGSKPKRPNRRYRRRPTQLLSEYNRRQLSTGIWLETHIWHAKRFRMTPQKWGTRLPDTPNDKGYRLAYRSTKNKAVMFDMSYYRLFEVTSNQGEALLKGLNSLLPPHQVLTSPLPHSYAHLHLYEPNAYPYGYIGAVSLHALPKPLEACWIWIHPSYGDKVLDTLQNIFAFECVNNKSVENMEISRSSEGWLEDESKDESPQPPSKKTKLNVNEMKLSPRNIPFERVPKYKGPHVSLNDLSYTINRYRLIGPHADRILKASLEPSNVDTKEKGWWTDHYGDDGNASSYQKQVDFWRKTLQTIPHNVDVLNLTTRDPRIVLPPKRSVVADVNKSSSESPTTFSESDSNLLMMSPLWDPEMRDKVSFSKCPDHLINEKRSKLFVPGTRIPLSDSESRIPVVLLRRKYDSDDYGQGWDFISPAGWGMPFWMCFVMHGARTGGQTEIRNGDFERGFLDVLGASPDSTAGVKEAEESALLDKEVYFRYPPDKRCNFRKTGFASPFLPKWKYLINDWIRDENPLVRQSKNKLKPNDGMISNFYVLRDSLLLSELVQNPCKELEDPHCLVPVFLHIMGKGTISKNAGIFIPTQKDLELLRGDEEGPQFVREPLQEDKEETCLRTSLKSEHSAKKINLRRKWKKVKDKLATLRQKNLSDKNLDAEIQKYQSSLNDLKSLRDKEVMEFDVKMRTLWLDADEARSFKDSSSRPVCGYVVYANFSLRKGGHSGLGFIAYPSMKQLNEDNVLLIRDNDSLQYRFVKMSIIKNNDSV